MTSIRYRIVERLFKTLRFNKMLDKQGMEFDKLGGNDLWFGQELFWTVLCYV